jgi:hypothetical protein
MACFCAALKPAVMTTAARVPFLPRESMIDGTVAGGVAITASSGTFGSASTESKHGWAPIALWCGLTSATVPSNAPERIFLVSVCPTVPGVSLAPMTATERGRKQYSRLRTVIQRVRTSQLRLTPEAGP